MKFRELIDNIDKSFTTGYYDGMELFEEFHLPYSYDCPNLEEHGFSEYQLGVRYDSDTYVGIMATFFEDEFAFISVKKGRKMNSTFHWASQEMHDKIYAKLKALLTPPIDEPQFVEFDDEMPAGIAIVYGSEVGYGNVVLTETGEIWKVTTFYNRYEDIKKWKNLHIERDGVTKEVTTSDVLIPWKIKRAL